MYIYKQYYNSNPVSISLYTTLHVLPLSSSFNSTFNLSPDVHRESPTYNCPCENTGVLKYNPTCVSDCPWLLFTVIANASRSGNCFLRNGIGRSSAVGANVILGINTIFPPNLLSLLIILHFNTFLLISNTLNQVSLHNPFDASRHPIFNSKSASESELETNGFRYCTVYHLYSFISYNLPT